MRVPVSFRNEDPEGRALRGSAGGHGSYLLADEGVFARGGECIAT